MPLVMNVPDNIEGLLFSHFNPGLSTRVVSQFRKSKFRFRCIVAESDLMEKIAELRRTFASGNGSKLQRAICVYCKSGNFNFASELVSIYLSGDNLTAYQESLCESAVSEEKRLVRKLLNSKREIFLGVWDLRDVPAWIVPSFIRHFRRRVHKKKIVVISGSDKNVNKILFWKVPENSHIPTKIDTLIQPSLVNF